MKNGKYLYQQITNDLKQQITSGKLKSNEKLPTEIELAQQYNVSKITSKKALDELKGDGLVYSKRGSGTFVSNFEKTFFETERRQNSLSNNSKEISMLLPFETTLGNILNVVNSTSKVLNKNGFTLRIYNTKSHSEYEKMLITKLYNNGSAGIIYYPSQDNSNLDILYKLYLNNFPIVLIDKYFPTIPINYVVSDNFTAGYNATEYLIKLGHKKISFISDAALETASSVRDRYFGYCNALKTYGLEINCDFAIFNVVIRSDTPFWNIYKTFLEKIVQSNVTAIFAINDTVASLLAQIATSIDLKIPDDISIIGFDNTSFESYCPISLTTIKQDFEQMGSIVANIIISSFKKEEHPYHNVKLETQLIERSSCKKIIQKDEL